MMKENEKVIFMCFKNDENAYYKWKSKNENYINEFCEILEERAENRFKDWLKRLDSNKSDMYSWDFIYTTDEQVFLYTIIKAKWENGLRLFLDEKCESVGRAYTYCLENKWLFGVCLLIEHKYKICEIDIECYIREKWQDAMILLLNNNFIDINNKLVENIVGIKWLEFAKILYENYECIRHHLMRESVKKSWEEFVVFLIKNGENAYSILSTAVFNNWSEGIEIVLNTPNCVFDTSFERTESKSFFINDFLKILIKNQKFEWLEKLLNFENSFLNFCDLSMCESEDDVNKFIKVLNSKDLLIFKNELVTKTLPKMVQKKDLHLTKFLIEKGARVDGYARIEKLDYLFMTSLHMAIYNYDIETVEFLLSIGANIEARVYADNKTPCYSEYENLTPLGLLWSYGLNPNYCENYESILYLTDLLLKSGAKATGLAYSGHFSSKKGSTIIGSMISLYQELDRLVVIKVERKKERLLSLIELVCTTDKTISDEYFAFVKNEQFWITRRKVEPVIHKIDCIKYKELFLVLMKHGYNPNVTNENGETLLHKYIGTYSPEEDNGIVQILIRNGADINKCDMKGRTPLLSFLLESNEWASQVAHKIEIYPRLMELGADDKILDMERNDPRKILENLKAIYKEMCVSEDEYERWQIDEFEKNNSLNMDDDNSKIKMNRILELYNYDEDAVENSPEYWDYIQQLTDD